MPQDGATLDYERFDRVLGTLVEGGTPSAEDMQWAREQGFLSGDAGIQLAALPVDETPGGLDSVFGDAAYSHDFYTSMDSSQCPSCHEGPLSALDEASLALPATDESGIGAAHRVTVGLDGVYSSLIDIATLPGYAVDGINHLPRLLNLIPGVDGIGPITDRPVLGSEYINENLTAGYEGYLGLFGEERPEILDETDANIQAGASYVVNGAAILLTSGGYAALRAGGSVTATALTAESTLASGSLLTRASAVALAPETVVGGLSFVGFTGENPQDLEQALASGRILWDWSTGSEISIEDIETAAPDIAEELKGNNGYGGTFNTDQTFTFN